MKKSIQQIYYNELVELYKKLNLRLNKHFSKGRFHQYSKSQQQKLLLRIERVKNQLLRYEKTAKYIGAALAVVGVTLYNNPANAQFGPQNSEFRVNTQTTSSQENPSIAMDDDGDFVVVWHGYAQDGSFWGIYGQRYNSIGALQGGEFQINTTTLFHQDNPTVAMDSDGDFVVAWRDLDYFGTKINAQRFNASGVAQGGEFQINALTSGASANPMIAMNSTGDFVVTWDSQNQDGNGHGIKAKCFNASGIAQGGEFTVNTYTTGKQEKPSVAMDNDGDFVITWHSLDQDGDSYGVYAQRYAATGIAQGSEFRVNTTTTDGQILPSAAMDSDGDFIISWGSYNQDGGVIGVIAQRYNALGVAQNSEFLVNTYTTSFQSHPKIAMDADGDFTIVWMSYLQDATMYGVYGQRFSASGTALESEFKINTYTTGQQLNPGIAMDNNGNFVVSYDSDGQDGSGEGVYCQRYGDTPATAIQSSMFTSDINIYPNPTKDYLYVNLEGDVSIKLLDLTGHVIQKEKLTNQRIQIDQLKAGNYFVEITKEDIKVIRKLTIE